MFVFFEYNSTGTPASSSTFQICVTHSGCTTPTTPTLNSPSNVTSNSVFLSWNNVGAADYDIYYTTGSCPWTSGNLYQNTTGTSITISGLSVATTYKFIVVAKNSSTCVSGNSNCQNATTIFVCPTPTIQSSNISFPSVGTNTMSVNWTNGSGTGRIVVAKAGGFINGSPVNDTPYSASTVFGNGNTIAAGEYVVYTGSGSGPVNITNLSPNTNYYFKVFEYNFCGSILFNTSNYTLNPNNQITNNISSVLNCTNAINISCGQSLSGTTGWCKFKRYNIQLYWMG